MRDKQERSAVRTDLLGKFGAAVFQYLEAKHTRYTKRYPDARLDVQVQHGGHAGEEWISIRVEEIAPHGEHERSTVISFALYGEHREKFLAFIAQPKAEG